MKLLVTAMCRNEEKIIPYFIHHYAKIADGIFLIDHQSTDKTVQVAMETAAKLTAPLQVVTMENHGYDDELLKTVKESAYKNFQNDFQAVIVCDVDEFWHHKDGVKEIIKHYYHERSGTFVIKPKGYQMVSESFPTYDGKPLIELVKNGSHDTGFDKPLCFSTNLNLYGMMGMHNAYHYGQNNIAVLPLRDTGMKLLHYKFLGLEHRIERVRGSANNLSEKGKEMLKNGIAIQFECNEENLTNEFKHWLEKATDAIV